VYKNFASKFSAILKTFQTHQRMICLTCTIFVTEMLLAASLCHGPILLLLCLDNTGFMVSNQAKHSKNSAVIRHSLTMQNLLQMGTMSSGMNYICWSMLSYDLFCVIYFIFYYFLLIYFIFFPSSLISNTVQLSICVKFLSTDAL